MRRTRPALPFTLFMALLIPGLAPTPAAAQDAPQATHLYEAYYKVNYTDLPAWTESFQTYSVPILNALRDEGVIEGWGHWQHNVGSEYNIRLGVRAYDWAGLGTFWDAYLGRLLEAMPSEEADRVFGMVEAHEDAIWVIGSTRWPETAAPTNHNHMYASTFRVNFAQEAEWDRLWNERVLPVLAESMAAGNLSGVVLLNHHSGGSHNRKVLYLFEEWDDMDNMWGHFFQRMEELHPQDLERMLGLVQAHDDVIWSAPPPAGNQ